MTQPKGTLPFAEIAAACLARADELLREWLPYGRREGPEWKALNPLRGDSKIGSFSVSVINGHWADFATDDRGGDLVSLNAYLFHAGDQGKAAVECAERVGVALPETGKPKGKRAARKPAPPPADPPKEKEPRTWWKPFWPVPDDAGEPPVAHPRLGRWARRFEYRTAAGELIGYVCRIPTVDGGKDDVPLCYARHEKTGKTEWRWLSFDPEHRPLYGLDRAAQKPEATLLFVEGEKCGDAGHNELPGLATMSWPGGCKAVHKADFSSLADRQVKKAILWPDCDSQREKLTKEEKESGVDPASKPLLPEDKQPGTKAMAAVAEQLHALGYKVWRIEIPLPGGEKPDGWDIADAIEEGWTTATLEAYIREKARLVPPPVADSEPASTPTKADAGTEGKGVWIPDLVWGRDGLKNCLSNVYQVLTHRPEWKGVIAYDEFSLCVVKRKPPPFAGGSVGEWDATDDSRAAMWLATFDPEWKFTPSSDLIAEAVEVIARANAYHPVRDYFNGLEWDNQKRLTTWLTRFLGVKDSDYSKRVSAWWLMGAVKRILQPGAKFDYCLVLAGPQGKKKSTAFEVLASPAWFGDTDLDLGHKDAMSALRGKLIYEIAELGALARSEEKRQKSFLSRRIDEYRPVYGRREIKAPRQVVFGGTTNDHEWNKDPTGGRRLWPVDCLVDEIDVAALRAERDQLWAEAVHYVKAGLRYWPTQEEQKQWFDPEQLKIEQQDDLVDGLHDWVYAQISNFTLYEAATNGLKPPMDASKLTPAMHTRLGIALRKLGCTREERRNGMVRYWYKPPARNEASSTSGTPAQQDEEHGYVGF
jgi:predicted P-loop ATPase